MVQQLLKQNVSLKGSTVVHNILKYIAYMYLNRGFHDPVFHPLHLFKNVKNINTSRSLNVHNICVENISS